MFAVFVCSAIHLLFLMLFFIKKEQGYFWLAVGPFIVAINPVIYYLIRGKKLIVSPLKLFLSLFFTMAIAPFGRPVIEGCPAKEAR